MKKIIVLLLCVITAVTAFSSCSKNLEDEDIGTTIPIYLSTEIANFDPAYSNLDDASAKILSLIYEGLFKIDASGKVVKAQAKSVKVLDKPSDDYYAIEIKLNYTCWSDGTQVLAADYIYAWKRILEPGFRGEAANMLFDIKNARAVNSGDVSVDDLGVSDVATDVIRIEFEGKTNYDKFYEYLASPMLVPLREIAVDKVAADWSSSSSIVVCNGPFCVRTYTPGEKLVLERNRYYYRDIEEDSIKKFVTPYRLVVNFKKSASENLTDLEAGNIVYDGELPLDKRAEYKDKAEVSDTMSVLSYVFNTKVAPFDNPDVRHALSLAIDRNAIVDILTFAKPAEGLIADGVYNTKYSKKGASFRDSAEALISASADVEAAKQLLNTAGVSGGDITITLRNNEADVAVAEYVKTVWEALGFKVTLNPLDYKKYTDEKEYDLVSDPYLEAYEAGDFQVISVDYQMLTTDAFPNLAQFAKAFASGMMDLDNVGDDDTYELATHVSGYYSAEYDAKMEEAFAEKSDLEKRAGLLHEAEAILMNDMPIIPLVQLQQATLTTSDISKLSTNYFGVDIFTKAVLKNISKYPDNVGYESAAE